MVYRKFNAPNVEYNEIDRSQYGLVNDGAAVGTMTFATGFADKGDDYEVKYLRSLTDFVNSYGYPTNEAERYFYAAAQEIFTQGGRMMAAKIPYDNDAKDKLAYTIYRTKSISSLIEENAVLSNSLAEIDPTITSYFELESVEKDSLSDYLSVFSDDTSYTGLMSFDQFDQLLVGTAKPVKNSIYIVDIARNRYGKDPNARNLEFNQTDSYLGYVPVIVSPLNALYYQNVLTGNKELSSLCNVAKDFQSILNTGYFTVSSDLVRQNELPALSSVYNHFSIPLASIDNISESTSKEAAKLFPSINFIEDYRLDPTYLKQIGVVVFKMVSDPSNDKKINFNPVEAFVGSLDKKAVDEITGKKLFIDDIINEQSEFINFFSNFDFSTYENRDSIIGTPLNQASTILISNQTVTSLGFFVSQCSKYITPEDIDSSLDLILDRAKEPLIFPIDIVVDAGVSNIAQYMKTKKGQTVFYEPEYDIEGSFVLNESTVSEWKKILKKFDTFARYTRKDCIFVADGHRALCLDGNQKIVRKYAPQNTISKNIVPKIRYMTGINSSYSAGYCNWFRCVDTPSIKAMGIYLYTDRYANTWDAPAGDNRGKIQDAYDIAFNPSIAEAENFYEHQWNYAIAYPIQGIVLEGQKTFQVERTALDRVNVRRLCLGIKKGVTEIARWFKYEKIAPKVFQDFRKELTDFLQRIKDGDGISEFYLKMDDDNNTDETIERNEIHVTIAIRPIKTAEFIIINSIIVNQSANLEEVTQSVLG